LYCGEQVSFFTTEKKHNGATELPLKQVSPNNGAKRIKKNGEVRFS
jgi:hypothetical protein